MPPSTFNPYRLDPQDLATINAAVDHGERLADPRLRTAAAGTASALLRASGWRSARRPLPLLGLLLSAAVLIATGRWWLLLILMPIGFAGGWLAERQARRLRPQWRSAIEANEDNPEG